MSTWVWTGLYYKYVWFFRLRLLYLAPPEIKKLLDGMEKEINDIKASALKMAWYMRGSIQYTDVLNLSMSEKEAISKLIEENLETTKKSNLPFF